MPLAASIEFPSADVDALFRQIERNQKQLGQSLKASVMRAAIYVAKSLSASTKIAPKLRRVVENPDKRYKTDHRRAPFGVMRYNPDGTQYFKPIYRTGEYGKLRFFDKKSAAWFKRDRTTGAGKWEKLPSGPDIANPDIFVPGIMTDKRRKIGRRGLAKKAWTWAASNMWKGGRATLFGMIDLMGVRVFNHVDNPGVQITNRLRYATAAFKDGMDAPERALGNAARKMAHNITEAASKKLGAK